MAIRVEVETVSTRHYEKTTSYFTDDERLSMGYWELRQTAETNGHTWYTITHDGWVTFEASINTSTGRAYCTHGKRSALPPFLRSHLPEILRVMVAGNVTRFEADPRPTGCTDMMDFQVFSYHNGRIVGVLAYCTLAHAQEIAARYERVLGVPIYRNTIRAATAPQVDTVLPELVRGTSAEGQRLSARLRNAVRESWR